MGLAKTLEMKMDVAHQFCQILVRPLTYHGVDENILPHKIDDIIFVVLVIRVLLFVHFLDTLPHHY